jgi:type I restriction enzyme, S subunit
VKHPVQSVPLQDVVTFRGGGTPPTGRAELWNGDIPWVSPKDVKQDVISQSQDMITNEALECSATSLIPRGASLVVVRSGILARTVPIAIAGRDLALNQDIKALCPSEAIDPLFLFYFLRSAESKLLRSVTKGATVHRLATNDLKNLKIPMLSPAAQKELVGILDESFAAIAAAKMRAERNIENARALVIASRLTVWTEPSTDGGSGCKLRDLCELIVDCEHKTAPYRQHGIPSIRTPNIGKGYLILDNVRRVSEETYEVWTRRAKPEPGDLIFGREAPAGNVAVIPPGLTVCLGQRTVLLRPKLDLLDPHFLALLLLQPETQKALLAKSRGATVEHVNLKDIRELAIRGLPPLEEQRELVAKSQNASRVAESLVLLYLRKRVLLDNLKQSILHAAFAGDLSSAIVIAA